MSNIPRIVIVGNGFGGVYTARNLAKMARQKKAKVTIIGEKNYFLFTPLLHEVATGGLSPRSVAEPLQEIFRGTGVEFRQAKVKKINLESQKVETDENVVDYDYLVLATGAETNFHNTPGAPENCLTLKSIECAARIRSQVIDSFEMAVETPDHSLRTNLLSFVVVGGGATGVELAAELVEFSRDTLGRYYKGRLKESDVKVTIIEAGKELLSSLHPTLRSIATKTLRKKGVVIQCGVAVKSISSSGVFLADESFVESEAVIWTAGVKPVIPEVDGRLQTHGSGRVLVDEYLRSAGRENVFVLGDVAAFVGGQPDGKPLPMFAQVAVRQASVVAKNIGAAITGRSLKTFSYHSKGTLLSLGQRMAAGDIYGIHLKGRFMWWIWRTVYLFKFISWRKRFSIALEWAINLFYPRDVTRLTM